MQINHPKLSGVPEMPPIQIFNANMTNDTALTFYAESIVCRLNCINRKQNKKGFCESVASKIQKRRIPEMGCKI